MAERTEHDYPTSKSSEDIESIEPHRSDDAVDEIARLEKQSTAASGYSAFEQRTRSIVSRIRSREPGQTAKFNHPLTHTKTSPDVIVDFDGPDDPYRPLNWSFRKKAITTVLYGLTTMGMSAGNVGEMMRTTLIAAIKLQVLRGRVQCMCIFACLTFRVIGSLN